MKCPNCGCEFSEGSFCPECGTKVEAPQTEDIEKNNTKDEASQPENIVRQEQEKTAAPDTSVGEEKEKKKENPIITAVRIIVAFIFLALVIGLFTGRFDDFFARITNGSMADNTSKVIVDKDTGTVYSTAPATEAAGNTNSAYNTTPATEAAGRTDSSNKNSSTKKAKEGTYSFAYAPVFDDIGSEEDGEYFLWDLNGDGIYELIIGHGVYESDYIVDFYTLDDDENPLKIGELGGRQIFLTAPNGNGIYAARERQHVEELYRMTMVHNLLIPEMIINKLLGEDEEYYSTENADTIIETTDINDHSLLTDAKKVKASNKSNASGTQIDYSQYDYVSPGYVKDQDTELMKEYLEPYSDVYSLQDQVELASDVLAPDVYYKYYSYFDRFFKVVGINIDGVRKMLRDFFRYDDSDLTNNDCVEEYAMELDNYNNYFNPWGNALNIDLIREYLYNSELQCLTEDEVNAMSNYEVSIKWFYVLDDYHGEPIDFNAPEEEVEVNLRKEVAVGNDYVLPDSDKRYYSENELSGLSKDELRIARNEIYARHGRLFDSADLNEYFQSKPWYNGTISGSQFDESVLNDYEKKNAELIRSMEGN